MKKILIAASICLLMIGCTKDQFCYKCQQSQPLRLPVLTDTIVCETPNNVTVSRGNITTSYIIDVNRNGVQYSYFCTK